MTNERTYRNTTFAQALRNYKVPSETPASNSYTGKAYALVYCNATRKEIEAELPLIRQLIKTPKNLELTVIDGVKNLKGDKELMNIAEEASAAGINYAIQAKCPKKDNKETADEIAAVLNQAYQTPLYADGEAFKGQILYRNRNQYKTRE